MHDNGFLDRLDAGHRLADVLSDLRGSNAVVVGLARGGVVVAHPIAEGLALPLTALLVRKLGAPGNPELAVGAISETGERWLEQTTIAATGATDAYLETESEAQRAEAQRRRERYGSSDSLQLVRGRTAIVVDDGIATGSSALVAARSVRRLGAHVVVLAAPVASRQALRMLEREVDRVAVLVTPHPFLAVGFHYGRFEQVSDDEVKRYLDATNGPGRSQTNGPS